jgi:hypothetical protein
MKSGTCSGVIPEQHSDRSVRALEHVAVAGEDQRLPAGRGLQLGERAEQVVGLEIRRRDHLPTQSLVQARRPRPLPLQRSRHVGPLGVVGGIRLLAVFGGLGAEAEHHGARRVLLHAPQHLVDGAEQRVDGIALRVGDRVGQRIERAVEAGGCVD